MQVWTCCIISMPSGGLVANHNRNQCITSTLGWRKFTVNRQHVLRDREGRGRPGGGPHSALRRREARPSASAAGGLSRQEVGLPRCCVNRFVMWLFFLWIDMWFGCCSSCESICCVCFIHVMCLFWFLFFLLVSETWDCNPCKPEICKRNCGWIYVSWMWICEKKKTIEKKKRREGNRDGRGETETGDGRGRRETTDERHLYRVSCPVQMWPPHLYR
jgi:hypothetical protein